jgi:hypothetical protein
LSMVIGSRLMSPSTRASSMLSKRRVKLSILRRLASVSLVVMLGRVAGVAGLRDFFDTVPVGIATAVVWAVNGEGSTASPESAVSVDVLSGEESFWTMEAATVSGSVALVLLLLSGSGLMMASIGVGYSRRGLL